jgi:hypothetical protein
MQFLHNLAYDKILLVRQHSLRTSLGCNNYLNLLKSHSLQIFILCPVQLVNGHGSWSSIGQNEWGRAGQKKRPRRASWSRAEVELE